MNDEIKEILDRIETASEIFDCLLKPEECTEILDYITNLQQENERLKETNVYCNRTDCVGRIKDSRKYDSVYQEKEDYKSRCEKAIEHIEEIWKSAEGGNIYAITIVGLIRADLLNILQNGGDK